MTFKLLVHNEAREWIPPKVSLDQLKRAFNLPQATVRIIPRRIIPQFHKETQDGFDYGFRGFTRGNQSYIFVDETENPHSIAWLMAHELCHIEIGQNDYLRKKFDSQTPTVDPKSDEFHRLDPEELYCDSRANNILGTNFDRFWWRAKVNKFLRDNRHRGKWRLHR